MLTDAQFQDACNRARSLGYAHGAARGSWDHQYLPGGGRYTRGDDAQEARRLLVAWDDGDTLRGISVPSFLSGEYSGDPTPVSVVADVLSDCGFDAPEDDDVDEEIVSAWESGAEDGFCDTVLGFLRSVAGTEGER